MYMYEHTSIQQERGFINNELMHVFPPAASVSEYLEEIWEEESEEEGWDWSASSQIRVCVCDGGACVGACDKQRGPAVSQLVLSDTLLIRQRLE